ncbi:hypothetical protein [Nonomuraea sp. NPDC050202]|uniref:hypothetical protein n=1 Tax=Nonomuraea sp. NPDC050202 TaxID=3155035 RepID=UPI0033DC82E1
MLQSAEALTALLNEAESWDEAATQTAAMMNTVVVELAERTSSWHAFDVLAWLQRANMTYAEDYQESTHDGLSALVELAALLVMERPSADAMSGDSPPHELASDGIVDPGAVAQLCRDLDAGLRRLINAGHLLNLARHADGGPDWQLRYHMVERELLLRNLGYPHMQERLLRGLFGEPPVSDLLVTTLGFTIEQALKVIDGLHRVIENAYWDSVDAAREHVLAAPRAADAVATGSAATRRPQRGRKVVDRERLDRSRASVAAIAAIVSDRLGRRIAITAEQLAAMLDESCSAIEAVLQLFSQPFGTRPAVDLVEDYFRGRNPLRTRAVLHDPAIGYFPVNIGNLLFGLRELIEDAFKQHNVFDLYAKHRGDWVEEAAVAALQERLAPEEVHRNIEFVLADGRAVESDALLVCDRVALAIEAKAVSLTPRARSGDPARMSRDLTRIVADTVQQADRLRTTLARDGRLRVRDRNQAEFDFAHVRRVFPIAVTLEDVTSVTGSASAFVDAGILPSRRELPWIVSLFDLWVICEIAEGPAQLLHYLQQHEQAINLNMITASEELDLFMMFLDQGLYLGDHVDQDGNPTTEFFTLSMTDPLDAYYLHQTGQRRTPAPKPRQEWSPKAFRELTTQLECERPDGWTTAALNLHQGDRNVRNEVATMVRRLARRTRLDGYPHDETRLFADSHSSFGVTGMSVGKGYTVDQLRERLLTWCRARKHLERAASWTGIGVIAQSAGQGYCPCATRRAVDRRPRARPTRRDIADAARGRSCHHPSLSEASQRGRCGGAAGSWSSR